MTELKVLHVGFDDSAAATGYGGDFVPCARTGACTFSGTLAQVGEPRLTVTFLLMGLASLAWLGRRRSTGHRR